MQIFRKKKKKVVRISANNPIKPGSVKNDFELYAISGNFC